VKNILNGEIYISIIRIRDNSKLYNVSFDNELYRVIIHGFLHLIKYDDLNIKDKIEMKKKENFYLNEFKDLFIVINKAKI
jgi:rRNA maturation RNase YbeY